MNVFVLGAGRSGTTTLFHALSHAENYTCAHEGNITRWGESRLRYPDAHIEVDNRLSWMLGSLYAVYGEDAHYIHATRSRDSIAKSYASRWASLESVRSRPRRVALALLNRQPTMSVVQAFAYAILGQRSVRSEAQRLEISQFMAEVVDANVSLFLSARSNATTIDISDPETEFRSLWTKIGARGDLDAAIAELTTRHNAGTVKQTNRPSRLP